MTVAEMRGMDEQVRWWEEEIQRVGQVVEVGKRGGPVGVTFSPLLFPRNAGHTLSLPV